MGRHGFTSTIVALIASTLVLPSIGLGQSDLGRFERQLEQMRREEDDRIARDVPLTGRAMVDYGAYFTFDYLSVDDNRADNHVLRQYDLVAYTRMQFDANEIFLRGRTTYQDFNDKDSFDGDGDEFINPDFDRAYYRLDVRRFLDSRKGGAPSVSATGDQTDLFLQVGRDFVYWGNGLTLGEDLDGVKIDFSQGPLALHAIAGVTPENTVDFDPSRPNFDEQTRRGFYGAMLSTQIGQHRPYIYVLGQEDYNKDHLLVVAPTRTRFDYNSYYVGIGSNGALNDKLLYGVEGVYEGGDTLSNSFTVNGPFLTPIDQTRDDIEAYAGDAKLDYLFNDAHRTRLSAEAIITSGDPDRFSSSISTFGGNKPGTTDRAFNALGLLNTGQAFAPQASNLVILRGGVSTFPLNDISMFRRMQLGADVFFYRKTQHDAPIDEPSFDNAYLGWEPDLFINWQIVSDVTLAVRYGVFFPSNNAFPIDDARQFFSTSITFAF